MDLDAILGYVKGKTILVTGGGGSIGSEICRQLAGHDVGHLIIFDIYENNAYQIQKSLEWEFPDLNLTVLIGSVRDERRLESIFSKYRPDIVFHAAAHKHVPLMEDSPNEAIKNNVLGTYKTAQAAVKYGVKKFVLISTDKAVNPTNIMGASKRLCEMVVQMMNRQTPDTDFVVRVTDVDENGRSIKLADGLLSARYRNGFARSEFLQEGEIVCLKIRTTKLSNCFRKGHRIRVTVTSSAKNFIFPNSNTREGFASARTVVAHNRVYHGGLHASRLTVRVEP